MNFAAMEKVRFIDPEVELIRFNDPSPQCYNDFAEHFCKIYDDMLLEETIDFECRAGIFSHFAMGQMYGLRLTDKKIKFKDSILPLFCTKDNDGFLNFIWTHPHYRKRGFAKKLIMLLDIKKACFDDWPEILGFWEKCGFSAKKCTLYTGEIYNMHYR